MDYLWLALVMTQPSRKWQGLRKLLLRYQRGNQNRSTKHYLHRTPLQTGGELICSGMVGKFLLHLWYPSMSLMYFQAVFSIWNWRVPMRFGSIITYIVFFCLFSYHKITSIKGKNYLSSPNLTTGARCVRKKKKKILYNTTRGRTHLLPFF
jgi:hypothetical protein